MNISEIIEVNLLSSIISETEKLKLEQQKVNEVQSDYVQGWIDFGGKISDVSNIMFTGVYDGISTALDETNYVDRFDSLGESLGSSLFSKMKQEMIDSNYGGLLAELNTQMVEAMDYGTAMNMGTISDIAQEIQKITAQTEYDALKLESAMSLFDVGDIDYVNQSQGITYETGTSSSLQVIYQNTFSNNIGNIVTTTDQTSINKLVDVLLPTIAERLETQLGKYFK